MVTIVQLIKWLLLIGMCLSAGQIFMTFRYDITHIKLFTKNSLITDVSYFVRGGSVTAKKNNSDINVQRSDKPSIHEGHNGLELATSARRTCLTSNITSSKSPQKTLQIARRNRLLYCPMEKIGTTFWRRVFYMLTAKNGTKYSNPYQVPIQIALRNTKLFDIGMSTVMGRSMIYKTLFSFLFVRNPYSRLLSAFIDKLVAPNPYYWNVFGATSIRSHRKMHQQNAKHAMNSAKIDGHDVTFAEFVKHVTRSEATGRHLDAHFISTFRSCNPCGTHYSYIGRMETFQHDASFILKKVGIDAMGDKFNDLTIEDAINDSIYSPYSWKKEIMTIISWEKALKRVWLKLQMKGIIGLSQEFPISLKQISNISNEEFINVVRKTHAASNPMELKEQRVTVKKEAFASVPLEDIQAFRKTFIRDFEIFGYDSSPDYVFDRSDKTTQHSLFDYRHLN